MNYNYLRYFSMLAQVEHYTVAAARLGISQPSLSNAIYHLETELGGVKLFKKVGRNVRLTEAGRYYQEKVDIALQELNTAAMTLRESMISAPVLIRMGFVSGTMTGALTREVAKYAKENERVRFRFVENSTDNLLDLLRLNKLDMAIVDVTNKDKSLHFRELKQQRLCVALSAEHPLANNFILNPKQILKEPQVAFDYDMENSFSEWGNGIAAERLVCTVNTAQAALDLVEANVGICIMSVDCIQTRQSVRFVPLKNWHQSLYLCMQYDKWLEPPIWEFRERIVKLLRHTDESI